MHYYYPVQISGFWEQLGRNRNRISGISLGSLNRLNPRFLRHWIGQCVRCWQVWRLMWMLEQTPSLRTRCLFPCIFCFYTVYLHVVLRSFYVGLVFAYFCILFIALPFGIIKIDSCQVRLQQLLSTLLSHTTSLRSRAAASTRAPKKLLEYFITTRVLDNFCFSVINLPITPSVINSFFVWNKLIKFLSVNDLLSVKICYLLY